MVHPPRPGPGAGLRPRILPPSLGQGFGPQGRGGPPAPQASHGASLSAGRQMGTQDPQAEQGLRVTPPGLLHPGRRHPAPQLTALPLVRPWQGRAGQVGIGSEHMGCSAPRPPRRGQETPVGRGGPAPARGARGLGYVGVGRQVAAGMWTSRSPEVLGGLPRPPPQPIELPRSRPAVSLLGKGRGTQVGPEVLHTSPAQSPVKTRVGAGAQSRPPSSRGVDLRPVGAWGLEEVSSLQRLRRAPRATSLLRVVTPCSQGSSPPGEGRQGCAGAGAGGGGVPGRRRDPRTQSVQRQSPKFQVTFQRGHRRTWVHAYFSGY